MGRKYKEKRGGYRNGKFSRFFNYNLKKRLPPHHQAFLRLFRNMVMSPANFTRHWNRFLYDSCVSRKETVDFVPPVFIISIADDCNLRCPTCLFLLEGTERFFSNFISPEKFLSVLQKYNSKKLAEIAFLGGGEPLLHPQLKELIKLCREFKLKPRISTNGILIKDKISSLREIDYVNVSIDAYDQDSFRKYRGGTPQQYDLIMEGLRALKEEGIYFSISFLLSQESAAGLKQMLDLAYVYQPNFVYFHNINPHGNDKIKPLMKGSKETRAFLEMLLSKSDYPFDINIPVIFDTSSQTFRKSQCIQPWYYFCFNSQGAVSYCCHLACQQKIGNVFNDYNFNSADIVRFRSSIINHEIPESCLFCQRRFMGQEFGSFDKKEKRWIFNSRQRH